MELFCKQLYVIPSAAGTASLHSYRSDNGRYKKRAIKYLWVMNAKDHQNSIQSLENKTGNEESYLKQMFKCAVKQAEWEDERIKERKKKTKLRTDEVKQHRVETDGT